MDLLLNLLEAAYFIGKTGSSFSVRSIIVGLVKSIIFSGEFSRDFSYSEFVLVV